MSLPQPKSLANSYRPARSSMLRFSVKLEDMLGSSPSAKKIESKLERGRAQPSLGRRGFARVAREIATASGILGASNTNPVPPPTPHERSQPPNIPSSPPSASNAGPAPATATPPSAPPRKSPKPNHLLELREIIKAHAALMPPSSRPESSEGTDTPMPSVFRSALTWWQDHALAKEKREKALLLKAREADVPLERTAYPTLYKPPSLRKRLLEVTAMHKITVHHLAMSNVRRAHEDAKRQKELRESKKEVATCGAKPQSRQKPSESPKKSLSPKKQQPLRNAISDLSKEQKEPQMLAEYNFVNSGMRGKGPYCEMLVFPPMTDSCCFRSGVHQIVHVLLPLLSTSTCVPPWRPSTASSDFSSFDPTLAMSPPPPKTRADPYRPIKSSTLKTSLKLDDILGTKPMVKTIAERLSRARHRWGRHSARAPFAAAARMLEDRMILVPKEQRSTPVSSALPQQESPSGKGAAPSQPPAPSQSSDAAKSLKTGRRICNNMLKRLRELKEEVAPGSDSESSHPTFECPEPISDMAPDSAAMRLVTARRDFTAEYPPRYADYLHNKICRLEEKKKEQAAQPAEINTDEAGTNKRDFCRPPHLHYSLLEVMTMRRIALMHVEIRSRYDVKQKKKQAEKVATLRKSKKKVAGESKQKSNKKKSASKPAPTPVPQRQPPPSATHPQATREAVARISGDRMQPQMLRIYEMFYKRGVLDKLTKD
ncbi:uncharacterized protein SCHCODRAFT_02577687 [Schizophyllum commune H4-8]|uniref:Uncharacterized protein n=1 Tax=Schizophyllum commune (strain H4-8 / FGSC 9210) TaxID=578458 RepID=D8Q5Z3_SCHCM|nr:uncharacterized protein SCHCODRAFT_02577687 [Schizophyllum commune H4-8]KAI5891963.1 hypothetical protein SCHCODRAFT_02577687 [Schizophyllum commune H4-8]